MLQCDLLLISARWRSVWQRYEHPRRTVPPSPQLLQWAETVGTTSGPYADISGGDYEGRTDCRKPASFAVALYCGIGSSSLNALVNAFERLHMVRAWNSSCTG